MKNKQAYTMSSEIISPFYINAYPFLAYKNDPQHIDLNYALFQKSFVVYDVKTKPHYDNRFEVHIDAAHAALEKAGFKKMEVLCLVMAGRMMISELANMIVSMWKRLENEEHRCMSILTSHMGPLKCLAIERDLEARDREQQQWILYSGGLDKLVKMWKVLDSSPAWGQNQQQQSKASVVQNLRSIRN